MPARAAQSERTEINERSIIEAIDGLTEQIRIANLLKIGAIKATKMRLPGRNDDTSFLDVVANHEDGYSSTKVSDEDLKRIKRALSLSSAHEE